MEFVFSSDPYDSVIGVLLHHRPDFERSAEYQQLIENAEDLPGVVAAAYARYMGRLIKSDLDLPIDDLMMPLNLLASWNDVRINTMLQDEVLEQLKADGILDQIKTKIDDKFAELLKQVD